MGLPKASRTQIYTPPCFGQPEDSSAETSAVGIKKKTAPSKKKKIKDVPNKAVAGKGIYTFSSPKNSSVNKIVLEKLYLKLSSENSELFEKNKFETNLRGLQMAFDATKYQIELLN